MQNNWLQNIQNNWLQNMRYFSIHTCYVHPFLQGLIRSQFDQKIQLFPAFLWSFQQMLVSWVQVVVVGSQD